MLKYRGYKDQNDSALDLCISAISPAISYAGRILIIAKGDGYHRYQYSSGNTLMG